MLRTNHPASLTARTHSLAVHLGPALGGSRFSITSHTRKLSSYLLYHSSLYFILAETKRTSLAGSQRGLSLPSWKDGDWDETAPFTGRAKMGKSVCVGGVLEERTGMVGTTQEIKKTWLEGEAREGPEYVQ